MSQSVERASESSNWNAVWSMTIGVSGLIIAEFLPAGVLTPMARDLGITEGMAGQAVTATSVFAVVTSLLIAYLTRKLDRRFVLLGLSFLLSISSIVVALAPNFLILLFGRVVLGISLGGFWSMAAAITIRLVRVSDVPKALSLIFGGSSFSSVLAAPLGSYLGGIVGWRNVFFFAAGVGLIAFIWQLISLPYLKPTAAVRLRTTLDVLRVPEFSLGLLALGLLFLGRFATFTYLRPFLEQTTHLSPNWVSFVLLIFGLAYFVGNWFAPGMIKRNLQRALMTPQIGLALATVGLMLLGTSLIATLAFVFLWGAYFGPGAPAWSTWIAGKVPKQAETAGGLYVAAIQFSAAFGAFVGGFTFDSFGSNGVFAMSTMSWLISAAIVYFGISQVKVREQNADLATAEMKIAAME